MCVLSVLVLCDPLQNVGHFDVASLRHTGWVSRVWRAQVQVMRCLLNVQSDRRPISTDVLSETTSGPWVQLSVAPDDIGRA